MRLATTIHSKGVGMTERAASAQGRILYSVDHGIALIQLHEPPANCYSLELMHELDAAILAARFDETVHVIVIRGAGDKFFCAGADIGMLTSVTPTFKYYFCLHANDTLNRLENPPKLANAALNGHTVGGGLEIALAADIRLARQGGGKLGLPEVHLGVLPGTGGTQRLARLVGKTRAIEMMATGTTMDFETAADYGLVNQVIDAADFMGAVMTYAKQFVPPAKASKAVGLIKRAVHTGLEVGFEQGLALERELQQQLFQSEDATEGLQAYTQKRPAQFKGR
jgi:enoyl-CoA hydratase/carnithine racemase